MHKHSTSLLVLFLFPLSVFASGGDILVSFWSELALFGAVMLSLVITRLRFPAKMFVFVAYLVAAIATHWATRNMPYLDNQAFIVSVSLVVPGVSWLVALLFMRYRHGANITSRSRHDAAKAARP